MRRILNYDYHVLLADPFFNFRLDGFIIPDISAEKVEETRFAKIASDSGRPTHYRNLPVESMKIEFSRVQEQICALSGKLPLYFASPE